MLPRKSVISVFSPALRHSETINCSPSGKSFETQIPYRKGSTLKIFCEKHQFPSIEHRRRFLKNTPAAITCGPLLPVQINRKQLHAEESECDTQNRVISIICPALRHSHSGKITNNLSIKSFRTQIPSRKASTLRILDEKNPFPSIESRRRFLKNSSDVITCGPLLPVQARKQGAHSEEPEGYIPNSVISIICPSMRHSHSRKIINNQRTKSFRSQISSPNTSSLRTFCEKNPFPCIEQRRRFVINPPAEIGYGPVLPVKTNRKRVHAEAFEYDTQNSVTLNECPALRYPLSSIGVNKCQNKKSLKTKSPTRRALNVRLLVESNPFQSIEPRKCFFKNPPEAFTCGPLLKVEARTKRVHEEKPKYDETHAEEKDAITRFDDIYNDGVMKKVQEVQQTWIDFPKSVKKKKIDFLENIPDPPPMDKRSKDWRPKTACKWVPKDETITNKDFSCLVYKETKNEMRRHV